jgi:hypothetical protein
MQVRMTMCAASAMILALVSAALQARSGPDTWVGDTRIDPKEVLRTLTSITLSVYCDQECRPTSGMVILDNLVFEK